jgi:aspartyl-tRNA(Asn)/glutamyl-tRNA(Gln) amidotransferase subunit A
MTDENICRLTARQVSDRYRERSLSPRDVAKASLARIDASRDLNVFVVTASADEIMRQAEASEGRWKMGMPLGPLDGVPITVKDALVTKQWPTLVGSKTVNPSRSLREDAPAIARMLEEGAIILGKTTSSEFGWKALGDSPLTGITRNPWNPEMTPGGSSAGSAAALAAGIGHAAIGTDAGGSVRVPGAFCGLVALKATRGRIPTYPPSALWTLGHIGPMCVDVVDTSLMLSVMTKPDARDWNGAPPDPSFENWQDIDASLKGLRVAYSPTFGYGKVHPDVRASVDVAVNIFEELGAHVEAIEKPFADPTPAFRILFSAGIAHSLRKLTPQQRDLLEPGLAKMVAEGEAVDRTSYMEASEAAMTLSREMRQFHEKYALLLSPTVAVPAFTAGILSPEGYDPDDWFSWSPFSYPFNMTGQPALTLPCGLSRGGLPIGLQLVGAHYSEKLLLAAARAFEVANPAPIGRAF